MKLSESLKFCIIEGASTLSDGGWLHTWSTARASAPLKCHLFAVFLGGKSFEYKQFEVLFFKRFFKSCCLVEVPTSDALIEELTDILTNYAGLATWLT